MPQTYEVKGINQNKDYVGRKGKPTLSKI